MKFKSTIASDDHDVGGRENEKKNFFLNISIFRPGFVFLMVFRNKIGEQLNEKCKSKAEFSLSEKKKVHKVPRKINFSVS